MYINIKTGDIQLFDKQIIAFDKLDQIIKLFPLIRFDGDYQDITFYKLDDILSFDNYEFRIHLSFKSEMLYTVAFHLTDNSIKKINSDLSEFSDKLIFIKDLYYMFITKTTHEEALLKKSKTQLFDWGHLALNKTTGKWPFFGISYNYERIKELLK